MDSERGVKPSISLCHNFSSSTRDNSYQYFLASSLWVDFHCVSCLLQLFYGAEPAHTFHYSYPKPQEVEVKEQHVKEKVKLDFNFFGGNEWSDDNSPSPKRIVEEECIDLG